MRKYPAFVVLIISCVSFWPVTAAAQSVECTKAYEKAQEEKMAGQLNAALVHLKSCIAPICPRFIREDCVRWMDETESALPSVVFAVRRDGKDLTDVEVLCDGLLLTKSLDGKAIPLDPGPHAFSFSIPNVAPVERQALIRAGERNRIINVEFRSAGEKGITRADTNLLAEPSEHKAGIGYLTYGLAGVGALGIAGFTLFGILGNNQKGDLERSCSPHCQSSQVDSVKTKYLIADTCLGVGLISLGVATYLFVRNHGESSRIGDRDHSTSIGFAPRASGAGGLIQLSSRF
jgi:hypothetical protein